MNNKKPLSRRASLLSLGRACTLAALGTAVSSRKAHAAPKKATAFALVGDRYHNSDYIRTALGKTLVEGAGLSIDFTDEVKLLNAETLKGYKMLIVFRDGMLWPDGYGGSYPGYVQGTDMEMKSIPPVPEKKSEPVMWMQPHQGKAVRDFVESGGSAFFFHNNSHVSLSNKDYRDVEGAIYTGHPPVRPFRVRITDKSHPITQGVDDFLVTDEQHYVTYDKDPKYVLMRSENADGLAYGDQGTSCEAGWAYEYGKGRVCFLAPGHMIYVLWNPEYVKLQQNAVKWLLREI
ncbi:MAG: ThuA domain-containing protein [Candidatus Latescibacteria bacterium]|nr:ThuA domain-containing protein [Candidatus Latescibacterota bacterium]